MKVKIVELENIYTGKPMFHGYAWENERWAYIGGDSDVEAVRRILTRHAVPAAPEKIVEEFEI